MSEPTAEPTVAPAESATDEPTTQPEPTTEPAELGDAGKKAIDRMKAERDQARKDAQTHAARLAEIEDSQKSEQQKLADRLTAAEQRANDRESELTRLRVALRHGIPEEDFDFLGSGSEEEIEARAERIAAKNKAAADAATKTNPPTSRRPVESLRPGATPADPKPADDSYPADFLPRRMRERLAEPH